MSSATFHTLLLATLVVCVVLPVAHADSKNIVGVYQGDESQQSSSLMQAFSSVLWATSKMGYIKVTNLEDHAGKALIASFNTHLREYVKAKGDPTKTAVTRAWSPGSGIMLMELHSASMAEYAVSTFPGLDVGTNVGLQTTTAAYVEAEGVVLCAWQRRQRFIIQFFLVLVAFFGVRRMLSSGFLTLDRKASKMTLPRHNASVVGGTSCVQAKQHTSCVARSLPKDAGRWEI